MVIHPAAYVPIYIFPNGISICLFMVFSCLPFYTRQKTLFEASKARAGMLARTIKQSASPFFWIIPAQKGHISESTNSATTKWRITRKNSMNSES
jgi:hypothetical protein